jgi:hypothetical protein
MCDLWCASTSLERESASEVCACDQQIKQIAHKQIDDQSLAQDLMELAAARIINLLIKLLSAIYSFFAQCIEASELFQLPTFLFIGGNKSGPKQFPARISLWCRGLCADGNFPSLSGVYFCLPEREGECVYTFIYGAKKRSPACVRADITFATVSCNRRNFYYSQTHSSFLGARHNSMSARVYR